MDMDMEYRIIVIVRLSLTIYSYLVDLILIPRTGYLLQTIVKAQMLSIAGEKSGVLVV